LVQGVVNTFVVLLSRVIGHFVDRVILKNERGHGIGFFYHFTDCSSRIELLSIRYRHVVLTSS